MELFKSRTRVAYTNAVGDKVYPVVVDIKKGIKSTEDIQFVSSDVNTGILSVAFISGNENFNVSGADVVCSVMRPDASTLELPCEVVRENIVEVPLGINGTSQDGVYSFDFKVLKGGNKIVGTPIMNYSVSLSIGNDMVIEEDDRLPILTMLITQVNELKEETRETVNQANVATEASREATANAIEATNNANAVSERVSQETATAISEIKQDTENAIANMNQSTSTAISTMNQSTTDAIANMNQSATDAIADMTQKTNEAVTRVNDNLANINNVVTTKVAELDNAKSDMTTTVSNKVNEVETRFNALTSSQQQDAEVIDARVDFKGVAFDSLKERIDYTDKLLRDSTISTVITESDFTTVEATSNGYFEDVKLEGKTLVNLGSNTNLWGVNSSGESGVDYNIISANDKSICMNKLTDSVQYAYFGKKIDANLFKANTEYTIVCNVNNVSKFGIMSGNTKEKIIDYVTISNGYNCFKAISTDLSTVTGVQNILIYGLVERSLIADNCSISDVIILEGDYTQNPPSYFEGLKSVGQSASNDGADEIVVSSVKGDGNLFDFSKLNGGEFTTLNGKNVYKYTDNASFYFYNGRFKKDTQYTITMTMFRDAGYETKGLNLQIEYTDGTSKNFSFTHSVTQTITSEQGKTIKKLSGSYNHGLKAYIDLDSICLNEGDVAINHQPHQTDEKRLLYYNEETQTWEKPILREGDSIEKHANGKYYYHQRSGEVVLNGSEGWTISTPLEKTNTIFAYTNVPKNILNQYLLCDRFAYEKALDGYDVEGVRINNGVQIRISKSKLSTQDVAGFKQWLQANNVTVVYQLAQEKVYECTNIDLITYANETNYIVESGAIAPKSILKVHNNISNVVRILQEKVSLLENKFIEGLKKVLAGDMYSLAELLYPEDFEEVETENNIMLLPLE